MIPIRFSIPLKTENEQNDASVRGNHFALAGKRKRKRNTAQLVAQAHLNGKLKPQVVVRLTRVSAGELDDDGLRAALKSVRDGIAAALRIDDGSKLIRFDYAQEKGPRGHHEVRVEVASVGVYSEMLGRIERGAAPAEAGEAAPQPRAGSGDS